MQSKKLCMESRRPEPNAADQPLAALHPAESAFEEILDWDFRVEVNTSARRSGEFEAEVKYVGRATPIPLADPRAPDAE